MHCTDEMKCGLAKRKSNPVPESVDVSTVVTTTMPKAIVGNTLGTCRNKVVAVEPP